MKNLFTLLLLAAAIPGYGRGTTITINGGAQISRLISVYTSRFAPGVGYNISVTARKPLFKGSFAGVEAGVTQLRHELKIPIVGFDGSITDYEARNCIVGQPSMHIGAQLGYMVRIYQSELSLAAQLAYVNNGVLENKNPAGKDVFYEQTTGARYGAKLEYTFKVTRHLHAGLYVNRLYYTLYSDTEKWGSKTYTFRGTAAGVSACFNL